MVVVVLHCSTPCGMAVGEGSFGVGFGLLWGFLAVSFGLMVLLFGNMVEASVASN